MKFLASTIVSISLILALSVGDSRAEIAEVLSGVCHTEDPKFSECVADVVDKIRPNIASGNFGKDRVAVPLDPYWMDKMDIDHGRSFRCFLRNVTIEGVSTFQILKIKKDIPAKRFNITVRIPKLFVFGKYDLDMNILLLKISGKGDFNLTLGNTLVSLKLQYFADTKDGKDYMQYRPLEIKFKFDKAEFYLKNLFNGDPALEKIGNQAINADPHVLLEEVRPSMEQQLRDSLTDISNTVVRGSEILELLPP
ncbi:uncharacterized protein LOC129746657 [Uranotaenia lowii]|uniref:uncharacterized protein LOC129746657 n=1 Tax=Uranotaenia lowii TaxID=190385 RepID=UPI002479F42A|nr:uncharacterized protein LOC129746657 [Uranotaenia lowii]